MSDVHECLGGLSLALLAINEKLTGYKATQNLASDLATFVAFRVSLGPIWKCDFTYG